MTVDVFWSTEIHLDEPVRNRLIRVIEEAEQTINHKVSSEYVSDAAGLESFENLIREYLRILYFAGLRAYMSTSATRAQIGASSAKLYVTILDHVFREKWRWETWDIQPEWNRFSIGMGDYIESLPEWREFLEALRSRAIKDVQPSISDHEQSLSRFLPPRPVGGFDYAESLEADWNASLRRLTGELSVHWRTVDWASNKNSYRRIFEPFKTFGSLALYSYLSICDRAGQEDTTTIATARNSFNRLLLDKIVPPQDLPDDAFSPITLACFPPPIGFGVWEQAVASSWTEHCGLVPADRNQNNSWALHYYLALRFPKQRAAFSRFVLISLEKVLSRWIASRTQARNPPIAQSQKPPYWNTPDPLFYFRQTEIEGLDAGSRQAIEAALLEAHAYYIDSATKDLRGSLKTSLAAYDGVAEQFRKAHLLNEGAIQNRIPQIIIDAGACGGWHFPRTSYQQSIINDQMFGQVWTSRGDLAIFLRFLAGRMAHWVAELKRNSVPIVVPSRRKRGFSPDAEDHRKVCAAVASIGDEWQSQIARVCKQLDQMRAKFPSSLKTQSISSWREFSTQISKSRVSAQREKFLKYVKYRLQWERRNPTH